MKKFILFLLVASILVLAACSNKPNTEQDPRKVVINLFGAMQENDTEALAHYIDFETMLKPKETDYALSGDTVREFKMLEDILADLVDGGLTKQRWFSMQRIVNTAEQSGDSALVEVSFINNTTSTQYMTNFGLRKINDVWKIYSFDVK